MSESERANRVGYEEDCYDKVRWNQVNQLHEATLQISNNCFGYKKMCMSLVVAGIAFISKMHNGDLLLQVEVGCLLLISGFGFWVCDANAYYYQKQTRQLMTTKINEIVINNTIKSNKDHKDDETSEGVETSWGNALVNPSMALYYILIFLGAVCLRAPKFL